MIGYFMNLNKANGLGLAADLQLPILHSIMFQNKFFDT